MNMPTRFWEFSAAAADYASNYAVGSPMWMNFYNEKFAELIMRECTGSGKRYQQQGRVSEMIVYVAFEFDGVGPDSPKADDIVELMSNECEYLCDKYGATAVWIDNAQGSDEVEVPNELEV